MVDSKTVTVDTRETPFLVQLVAWANVATGLLLLTRFLYFSSAKSGHTEVLIAGIAELLIAVPLAFGARWAYWVTLIIQPFSLVASVWLFIDTKDSAFFLPIFFFGLTTYFLLAPTTMTRTAGLAVRAWARAGRGSKPATA